MSVNARCVLAGLLLLTHSVPGWAQTCPSGLCLEAITASDRSLSLLRTGDFNGDGVPDVIGSNFSGLYLLTGTGGGHFAPAKLYTRQNATRSMAVADIDGDGRSDVAVTNTGLFNDDGTSVSIYRGNADGTLGPPLNIATAQKPRMVAFAEVIGGAGIDLLVYTESNRQVAVFPGNGDGTFGSAVTSASGFFVGGDLVVRDINQDGRADLLFGGSVALGNGDGTFGPESAVGAGLSFLSRFAVGDWDRNGTLDLALVSSRIDADTQESSGSIAVLLGHGDGTFEAPLDYAPFPGSGILDIGAGDLTGDGVPDIAAVTSSPDNSICILVGRGDGTFGMNQKLSITISMSAMALADLDRDGRLDLATSGTGTVAFLNRGFTPTLDHAPTVSAPAEVAASAYDPVVIKVAAVDPDLDPLLSLTADLSDLPTGSGATFSASRQSNSGVLNWTPRASDAGTYRITFTASNALTGSATTLVHVVRGSGAPGGQLFQSFYQTFDAGFVRDIAVADLDRDGRMDVLTVGEVGLSFFPGRGDATLSAPRITSASANQFLLDDVNGDGLMDVVGSPGSPSLVVTYFGNGDGSFAPGIVFDTGGSGGSFGIGNARVFALADLDRDLKTDLVVLDGNSAVRVLLGNGDGTFRNFHSYPAGTRPESIRTIDVNHDGVKDLVVVEAYQGIAVMIASGDGTLQPPVTYPVSHAFSVASGDVNGDGYPDLAVARLEEGLTVLLGSANGSFQVGDASSGAGNYYRVALADMNGDGRDDVIGPDVNAGNFDAFLSGPDGSLGTPRRTSNASGDSPIALGSLNGDGFLDLVAGSASDQIATFTGNGDGTFGTGTRIPTGTGVIAVTLARLDSDPFLDLAVAHDNYVAPFSASVLLGHGDGTFGARTEYETGPSSYGITVGDLNADGHADIVVSNLEAQQNAVSLLLGNGDGTFQPQRGVEVGPGPYSSAIGDFNRDGKMDLAVANFPAYTSGVRLALGNGDGTFQPPVLLQSISNALSVAAGDLDGDGILDIAATEGANAPCSRGCGHTIFLLLGNGDGTFRSGGRLETPIESEEILIEDLNRDGKADLVLKTYSRVCIFLGTGGGGFLDHQDFAIGNGLSGVAVGDVDGDGVKDVVTANNYDSTVSVLLGSGGGSFGRRHDFGPGPIPSSIALGDVNGDGRPDLVVGSETGYVSILLNLGPAPPPSLRAGLTLDPHVLNLKSHGQDVTAYIELPAGVSPTSIDIPTVRLDGRVPAGKKIARVGDHDSDGIPDLMLKFDRAALSYLEPGERELTATGLLVTGESFEGRATIRVIQPGSGKGNLKVKVVSDPGTSSVTISSIDEPGAAHTIEVFDVQGRLVRRWSALAGEAELRTSWDGRRANGARCGSGIYFIRVAADGRHGDGRAVIVR